MSIYICIYIFIFIYMCVCVYIYMCICVSSSCFRQVPGYLFFPPNGKIESPLTGISDLTFPLILRRFSAGEISIDMCWFG